MPKGLLLRLRKQFARVRRHSELSFLIYRYRYLLTFTLIGLMAVLLEVQIAALLPGSWAWGIKALLAFFVGLVLSFGLNVSVNFQVPRSHRSATFRRYALVSVLSFALNMAVVDLFRDHLYSAYAQARLISAGFLFLLAYTLHRRYTFELARNFGVAVYATPSEQVRKIFARLGRNCDHIHVDLVDQTMVPRAEPVDLKKLRLARQLWSDTPVCLHLMSLTPRYWVEQTLNHVDWYLFHVNVQDDLLGLIADCRLWGKKVGVVWHCSTNFRDLLPYLPHVDFVMALGIAQPGQSGQRLLDEALKVTDALDRLRHRYGYAVMFDGGVNLTTIDRIRAKYVVAASGVLRSHDPIRAAHSLRTGARYERRAA